MAIEFSPNEAIQLNSTLYLKLIDSKDIVPYIQSGDISIEYYGAILDPQNSLEFQNSFGRPFIRSVSSTDIPNIKPAFSGEIVYLKDKGKQITWNGVNWIDPQGKGFNPLPSGEGPAGTYYENFSNMSQVLSRWYTPKDHPKIYEKQPGSKAKLWNFNSKTPSGGTGISSPFDGSYFLYAEMSSGGYKENFKLRTTYFKNLQSINFYYNMTGRNIGTFKLNVYIDGKWINKYQNSSDTGNIWQNVYLDLSGLGVEDIEFEYSGATGYRGDFCLDSVTITSI